MLSKYKQVAFTRTSDGGEYSERVFSFYTEKIENHKKERKYETLYTFYFLWMKTIKNTGVESIQNMGLIMGAVMKKLAGSADGKMVQKIVREELNS